MKNYKDIADNVLKRRDEYLLRQKRRRSFIMKTVSSVMGTATAVFVGILVYNSSLIQDVKPDPDKNIYNVTEHTAENNPEITTDIQNSPEQSETTSVTTSAPSKDEIIAGSLTSADHETSKASPSVSTTRTIPGTVISITTSHSSHGNPDRTTTKAPVATTTRANTSVHYTTTKPNVTTIYRTTAANYTTAVHPTQTPALTMGTTMPFYTTIAASVQTTDTTDAPSLPGEIDTDTETTATQTTTTTTTTTTTPAATTTIPITTAVNTTTTPLAVTPDYIVTEPYYETATTAANVNLFYKPKIISKNLST